MSAQIQGLQEEITQLKTQKIDLVGVIEGKDSMIAGMQSQIEALNLEMGELESTYRA